MIVAAPLIRGSARWHNPRSCLGMLSVRLLVLVGCLLPSPAAAQAWLDAYSAREYARAAALLHEIVTDPDFVESGRDPLPIRHLALLYANGLGVAPDPIAACALARDAEEATHMAPPTKPLRTRQDNEEYRARLEEATEFAIAHCVTLSATDLTAVSESRGGCYGFGMPEQVVVVGGNSVRIGRAGIALAETPDRDRHSVMCPAAIGRVRPISIEPPEDAAPGVAARHFIEVVLWRSGRRARTPVYVAFWQFYEVSQNLVRVVTEETLEEAAHWPGAVVPINFDARLTIEMIRSGHVRWRIDGAPPRRGWLMLPEQRVSQ